MEREGWRREVGREVRAQIEEREVEAERKRLGEGHREGEGEREREREMEGQVKEEETQMKASEERSGKEGGEEGVDVCDGSEEETKGK